MKPSILPTYYNLEHFSEMVSFVEVTYGAVMDESHHASILCDAYNLGWRCRERKLKRLAFILMRASPSEQLHIGAR